MKTLNFLAFGVVLSLFVIPCYGQMGCCNSNGSCGGDNSPMVSNTVKYAKSGGTVRQAGKYYVEMVSQLINVRDPITFYLMNKKGKPVNNGGISGIVTFTFADGSTETDTLEPRQENSFAIQLKNRTQSFVCIVTFKIKEENITASFDGGYKKANNTTAKAAYYCPMHPEVTTGEPGNCPKCGMSLVKK